MRKLERKPPERKLYEMQLRSLEPKLEALEVDIALRKTFDVYISRLKKQGLTFTTQKVNTKLLIYRTK